MSNVLLRDLFEMLFVVAIGGMVVSAVKRLRRGQIRANICPSCERPTSRAYPNCTKCGAEQTAQARGLRSGPTTRSNATASGATKKERP